MDLFLTTIPGDLMALGVCFYFIVLSIKEIKRK